VGACPPWDFTSERADTWRTTMRVVQGVPTARYQAAFVPHPREADLKGSDNGFIRVSTSSHCCSTPVSGALAERSRT
jgi:hypothetical protein